MKNIRRKRNKNSGIATVVGTVVMLFLLYSCGEKTELIKAGPREQLPRLKAEDVSTIISDSGITRYRITTPEWLIFDLAEEPYWNFPKGMLFEKFDEQYNVDAEMKSNQAVYYEKKQLWEFSGDVKAMNLEGEVFETDRLYWDDPNNKIYSNDSIRITQKEKVIMGVGFESNATLTQYTIRNPYGIIPIDEEETE